MRIGFFGGGPQAQHVLAALLKQSGWVISFFHPRWSDDPMIAETVIPAGIEIMPFPTLNSADAVEYVRSKALDLIVSVNAKQIFRAPLLGSARHGAINLHNGLLPRQRGGGGAYVGMINGEPLGTTLHLVDEGIDTGDILLQREHRLGPDATMADLQRAAIECAADLVVTGVRQIESGTAIFTPQRDRPFYYVPAKASWDELIDWREPSQKILDKIRARSPGPINFYLFKDTLHYVLAAEPEPLLLAHDNTVGQVLIRDPQKGVLVKTGDSGLWITRIRKAGEDAEYRPDHPSGSLLRLNLDHEVMGLKERLRSLEELVMNKLNSGG